ncbi:MAG: hypothetical protein U0992_07485 [Planctomycetaceae bacterium]
MKGQQGIRHEPLRRTGATRLACAGGLMSVAVATAGWAYQAAAPAGLNGVLPTEVPAGLDGDSWNVLGPNWTAWTDETAGLVKQLYETENADLAAQQATLGRLRIKLGTIEKALNDSKYRVIHSQLTSLHGRLARRIDLAEALLETMDADPVAGRARRTAHAYARVSAAIAALDADLKGIPAGSAWLPYVRAEQIGAAATANDTSAEAIERLTSVQNKINNRGSLSDEAQKEFLGRPTFGELAAAIGDVLTANAWQPAADQVAKIHEQAVKLVAAVEAYEVDGDDAAAAEINAAYQGIKAAASDGGERISAVMREHYFGHNMRIIASEGFMKKAVSDNRMEQSYINEPVSEAWVSGWSCTYTNVSVDLQPNSDVAQFDLKISGTVNSTTTANAAQAVVYGGSTGNFVATKPVQFDGKTFTTSPVSVAANANTYFSDVDAKVFFLLRPIADLIATNEVANRKPQTDAIARQRMVDQVTKEVNTETDQRFSDASLKLESKTFGPLRELGWYPDSIQTYSTSDDMVVRARLMDPQELGAQAPAGLPAVPSDGVAIQVHESALNNGADRLDLAGKTMTDEELRQLMEQRISKLLGREFKFTPPEEEPKADGATTEPPAPAADNAAPAEEADAGKNKYVFDTHDPLRFQIDNGKVTIELRTGLVRPSGDKLDTHVIRVPLKFAVEGDKVVMTIDGQVGVKSAPGTDSSIGRQGIMRASVKKSIPERTFKGSFDVEQEGKTMTLHVTSVDAQDGWVTVLAK